MSFAGFLMKFMSKKSAARFEQATQDPVTFQENKLVELVRRNAGTEYGKRYGFASIENVEDWRKQVPVVSYEDIKEDVTKVVQGEENILTAERPTMFAQTSGTTGDPKYIPVTPTCQGRDHKDVTRTWLYNASVDHPNLFKAKTVSLVSPAVEGHTPSGIPFGSTSGHMYKSIPSLVQRVYALPYETFEIADYQAKYYAIMRVAIEQDVSFLPSANPSSILKLCEKGDEFSEDVVRDIHDGTLSTKYRIEENIRRVIESKVRPNPDQARYLEEKRSQRAGILKPVDYWPNLALIGCWKGGTVGHYLEKFEDWFNPEGTRSIPVRDLGYLASEMRGSIPVSDKGSQGVLTIASNFYEFVRVDQPTQSPDNPASWDFLTVGDIEDGKEYYIFVSTSGGLYRYDINDIVRVEGKYNETPQIVFVRKGRGMTNITGEKLSVNQVIEAHQEAARRVGIVAAHFKTEVDIGRSRYIMRVEFSRPSGEEERKQFLRAIDDYLSKVNIEYEAKRKSLRLNAPVLHVMREGWYERNRKAQAASGKRMFQAKTVLLSPDKEATSFIAPDLEGIVELDEEGSP